MLCIYLLCSTWAVVLEMLSCLCVQSKCMGLTQRDTATLTNDMQTWSFSFAVQLNQCPTTIVHLGIHRSSPAYWRIKRHTTFVDDLHFPEIRGHIDLDTHLLEEKIIGPGSGTRSGTRSPTIYGTINLTRSNTGSGTGSRTRSRTGYLTVQQVTVQVYISPFIWYARS